MELGKPTVTFIVEPLNLNQSWTLHNYVRT